MNYKFIHTFNNHTFSVKDIFKKKLYKNSLTMNTSFFFRFFFLFFNLVYIYFNKDPHYKKESAPCLWHVMTVSTSQ